MARISLLRRTVVALSALMISFALLAGTAQATKVPRVMAALGDSITRAYNTTGGVCPTGPGLDCPQNSWATGTNPTVDSFRERLDAISPQPLTAYNDAVSGARAVNLLGQAEAAASQDPDLVLIEIGANDACALPTPTPTATFQEQVREALEVLVAGNKQVYIQLMSIPDINNLRTIFTEPPDQNALLRWELFHVCQGLLANPLSTEPADEERREVFRAQVIAYNEALEEVCAEFKRCIWDDYAVFNSEFTTADVANVQNTGGLPIKPFTEVPVIGAGNPNSTADYFHPSVSGQAKLAEAAWSATFNDWQHRMGAMAHAG
ncbi:MAG TPA: SGNH/GDSL hydrolase family protein [Solirubrobacterales bacterium]|nr:SGNH/GDSL hydrolase family protein [Solirubrobacterales bacterium]